MDDTVEIDKIVGLRIKVKCTNLWNSTLINTKLEVKVQSEKLCRILNFKEMIKSSHQVEDMKINLI